MNISNDGGGLSMTGVDNNESSVSGVDDRVVKIETLIKQFEMYRLPLLLDVKSSNGFGEKPPYEVVPFINFLSPLQIRTINIPSHVLNSNGTQDLNTLRFKMPGVPDGIVGGTDKYIEFRGKERDAIFSCNAYFGLGDLTKYVQFSEKGTYGATFCCDSVFYGNVLFHYLDPNDSITKEMEIGTLINKTFAIEEEQGKEKKQITDLDTKVSSYDAKITKITEDNVVLNTKVSSFDTAIKSNTYLISENSAIISKNTSAISANTKNIKTNTSDIETNKTDINNINEAARGIYTRIEELEKSEHFSLTDGCIQSNHLSKDINILTNGTIEAPTFKIKEVPLLNVSIHLTPYFTQYSEQFTSTQFFPNATSNPKIRYSHPTDYYIHSITIMSDNDIFGENNEILAFGLRLHKRRQRNDIDEKITDELIISEDAYNAYKTDNRILAYEIITVPNPFESFQTYTLPTPFFIPKGCYLTADHRYSNSAKDSNLNLRNNYILNGYQA